MSVQVNEGALGVLTLCRRRWKKKQTVTTHCDLCYVTVRIMDGILGEERIGQCSNRQKEGKGAASRGICVCKCVEDREGLVRSARSTRRCLMRLEGRGG